MKFTLLKISLLLLLITGLACTSVKNATTQQPTTIIILRHAEKDPNGGDNPTLSVVGTERARRLSALFPSVTPDAFYSTNYIRTKQTLSPWAQAVGKEIQFYDAAKQPEFAEMLLKQTGKTIVVAGHSNTAPGLVNLLLNQDKFQNLGDNEYDKIFVLNINNGKPSVKVMSY